MTTASNYIALGPDGDVQELPSRGRTFSNTYEDGLYREDRAASTKLRRDIRGIKRSPTIEYSYLQDEALTRLEYLFELGKELNLVYNDKKKKKNKRVLMLPIDPTRVLSIGDGLWSGVQVVLREV